MNTIIDFIFRDCRSESKELAKSVLGVVPGKTYSPSEVRGMPIRDPAKLEKAKEQK